MSLKKFLSIFAVLILTVVAGCQTVELQDNETHREEILERQKAHYEANKEKILEKAKAYREANREKIRERQKAYKEAHKEEIREKK